MKSKKPMRFYQIHKKELHTINMVKKTWIKELSLNKKNTWMLFLDKKINKNQSKQNQLYTQLNAL
jgi:hypothetical protein